MANREPPSASDFQEKRAKIDIYLDKSFPDSIKTEVATIVKITQIILKDRINDYKPRETGESGESYVNRLKKYEHYDYHSYSSYMGVDRGPFNIDGNILNTFKPYGTLDQSATSVICEFLIEMIREFTLVLTTRRSLLFETNARLYDIYALPECNLAVGLDGDHPFTAFVAAIAAYLPITGLNGESESRIREEYIKLMKRVREHIKTMVTTVMGTSTIDSFGADTPCAGFTDFSNIFWNFLIGLSVKLSLFTFVQPGKITFQEIKSIMYHALICNTSNHSDIITAFKPTLREMFAHYEEQKREQNAELKVKRDIKKKEKTDKK